MKNGNINIEKLMKMATLFSVVVALSIIFVKIMAWFVTDSLSLLSSLVDSVLDVAASLVSFIAVRYALQPADEDHRFGHGKAEDIAAFAQSTFIAGSGVFVLVEACHRFFSPQPIENELIGIWVMIGSSVLTACLLAYQRYVIRVTNSNAIKADSLHYQMDLLVNLLVVVSLVIVMYGDVLIVDTIFALIIAIYILVSAWNVGSAAFDNLMDKEFDEETRKKIIQTVLSHKEVKGMHDLRTRRSGTHPFIQLHLEMEGSISLLEAHRISEEVMIKVQKKFPNSEVLIHQDIEGEESIEPSISGKGTTRTKKNRHK